MLKICCKLCAGKYGKGLSRSMIITSQEHRYPRGDLWYRCSALPTELSSRLGAGHVVSSLYTRTWWRMQVNRWRIIYLNNRERYEDIYDHRSCTHNLNQASTGFEHMTSAIPVQCSTNWPISWTGQVNIWQVPLLYIQLSNYFLIGRKPKVNFRNQRPWCQNLQIIQ